MQSFLTWFWIIEKFLTMAKIAFSMKHLPQIHQHKHNLIYVSFKCIGWERKSNFFVLDQSWCAIYQLTCGTIRSVMKMEVKLLAQKLPPLPLYLHPSSQPPVCPPECVSGEELIPFTLGSILINDPHSHCHSPSCLLPVFLVPAPLLCLLSLI